MTLMRWSEKMSVGIPELDADHKELIRVINQLAADANEASRLGAVRQSLFALLRYAEFHFAREEKVMAACRHIGVEAHKRQHKDFVDRIGELNRRFDQDPDGSALVVNEALLQFLQDWLNHHILIEDKAYRVAAEASQEARQAAKTVNAIEILWSG